MYAMQAEFPLQAAKHAARLSTTGVAMGAGAPAGMELMGLACVPVGVVVVAVPAFPD